MSAKRARKTDNKRWVRGVKTVSTFPPEGTFTKDAETIAEIMARKDVSPRGLGSAIRMVQYFINRGGKGLSTERRKELEQARKLLQERKKREG
jgi:tRNA(adenine34) deaminase